MAIPLESFEVQVESPVDFASLKRNGMNLEAEINAQQMFEYFHMLNRPTYVKLVKDFWVRAEVYFHMLNRPTKGVSQNHLLSFDNNKVLKIINWIC